MPNSVSDIWPLIDASGDCWIWTGFRATTGYGVFNMNNRQYLAHRLVYETLVGLIPPGLTIDHLCRRHECVNPDHLEPVTSAVNSRRGMSRHKCKRGHSLIDAFIRRGGGKNCRPCLLESTRRRRAKLRDADDEIQPVDPYLDTIGD